MTNYAAAVANIAQNHQDEGDFVAIPKDYFAALMAAHAEAEDPIGELHCFGCWKESGHYMFDRTGRSRRAVGPFDAFDASRKIDAAYAPWPGQDETKTNLAHTNGWTVLAMWDRSVDTRPGSNAAFIAEGLRSEAAMWKAAVEQYPFVVRRLAAAKAKGVAVPS